METTVNHLITRNIASSVRRTVRVTDFLEKNQVKKQAKLSALKLVASDLSSTLFGDNRVAQDEFIKACGF